MLQKETADEELEHFEDIVEDGDNKRTFVSDKRENNSVHDETVAKSNVIIRKRMMNPLPLLMTMMIFQMKQRNFYRALIQKVSRN